MMNEKKEEPIRFTSGYSDEALPFSKQEAGGETRTSADQPVPCSERHATPASPERQTENPEAPAMRRARPDLSQVSAVPERIREMRSIAPDYTRYPYSKNLHFYRQGKWMEDYEELSYDYRGRFVRYFPTYQTMNNDQLRGYFAWRTRMRRFLAALKHSLTGSLSGYPAAVIRKAADTLPEAAQLFDAEQNLSFLYLWIYELISGIGVTDEEGFENLKIADALAGSRDPRLHGHLRRWTADYIIYCGLDRSLALPYFHTDLDEAMETAREFERSLVRSDRSSSSESGAKNPSDTDPLPDFASVHPAFLAVNTLSKTDLTRSPLYRKNPEDVERAALHVYRAVCLFYLRNGKPMLLEQSFGGKGIYPYRIFDAAVFYDYRHYEDYTYEVDKAHIFHCTNGSWRCEKYLISGEKSRAIGMIFHETDRLLRIRLGFGRPLKPQMRSSVMTSIVADAIDEYLEQKREALRPKVHIDPAHLASIRSDAARTRDRLITEAELEDGAEVPAPPSGDMPAKEEPSAGEAGGSPGLSATHPAHSALLSDDQAEFLRLLISGSGWKEFVSSRHMTLSILIDEINEALYDEIGDTVIDTSAGDPEIIGDYLPDVVGFLETE